MAHCYGRFRTASRRCSRLCNRAATTSRVLMMSFSEFGRRVKENAAAREHRPRCRVVDVRGFCPGVKGGVVGKHPSLADLDAGDLKYHTDFRRVYATLLDNWLGVDSKAILGGAEKYKMLDFIGKKA